MKGPATIRLGQFPFNQDPNLSATSSYLSSCLVSSSPPPTCLAHLATRHGKPDIHPRLPEGVGACWDSGGYLCLRGGRREAEAAHQALADAP